MEVIIFMKILESFPHLINPAVASHIVLYFNMSFRVYQAVHDGCTLSEHTKTIYIY